MQSFIDKVAEEVLSEQKNSLNNCCVVFPTRRACGLFKSALGSKLDTPTFGPDVITITDFILEQSDNQVADKYTLLVYLYKEYNKLFQEVDFVKFYHWGQMLLNDFDEIDRNLADPKKIFSNLEDLKKMDLLFLSDSDEQKAIDDFIKLFDKSESSGLQQNFLSIWDKLYTLYINYNSSLSNVNICYEGKAYRNFSEKLEKNHIQFKWSKIYFAGFYALAEAESVIFSKLTKDGLASCLWDTDEYYANDESQEAGKYLRKNELLKGQYKWKQNYFKEATKNIKVTAVPQRSGQAQYIGQLLTDTIASKKWDASKTVLVLADETLLFPVLNHMPAEIKKLNITMGFPVKASKLNEWLNVIINFKKTPEGKYVPSPIIKSLLEHYYCSYFIADEQSKQQLLTQASYDIDRPANEIAECLKNVFFQVLSISTNNSEGVFKFTIELLQLLEESINDKNERIIVQTLKEEVVELHRSLRSELSSLDNDDAWYLIKDIRNSINIPFDSGDGTGLQIMGFLESRLLDFENVIISPVNEGSMPASSRFQTFIPFTLRKAFKLSTFQDKDAVYAYHFYRLLQRAKNVELIYNTKEGSLSGGDKSRYLLQIKHEMKKTLGAALNLQEQFVSAQIKNVDVPAINISKSDEVMAAVESVFGEVENQKPFSASSLLSYIKCPLQFYFNYVAKLRDPSDDDEVMDASAFGSIVHAALEKIYEGKEKVTEEHINAMRSEVGSAVSKALETEYSYPAEKIRGKNLLTIRAIHAFVDRVLDIDQKLAPFKIEHLEEVITVDHNTNYRKVKLTGTIDRVDSRAGTLTISDYKTGNVDVYSKKTRIDISNLREIAEKKPIYFQVLFYGLLKSIDQNPAQLILGTYPLKERQGQFEVVYDLREGLDETLTQFKEVINELVEEIFNPTIDFSQTQDLNICSYCDYKGICGR